MSYLREMAERGYRPEKIGPFHEFMIPWLLSYYGISKEEVVVDIGAGQGHALIPLYRTGWTRLVAVDSDDCNFELFKNQYGARVLLCDVEKQPLDLETSSVGVIICLHLIEHLRDPSNLLSECLRTLKPNGKLFVVTPDWRKQYKTFWRDPTHVRPYDKESIERLLNIHGFATQVFSWNSRFGLGRLRAYRWFPRLGMIGMDLLAVSAKVSESDGIR